MRKTIIKENYVCSPFPANLTGLEHFSRVSVVSTFCLQALYFGNDVMITPVVRLVDYSEW